MSIATRLKNEGLLVISAGLLLLSLPFVMYACGGGDVQTYHPRPMPCAKDEVYVWQDYPDVAKCVSNTDHAAHMGM